MITKPRVSGHRDFNLTTCPGDLMFNKLSSVRSTAAAAYKAGLASKASEVTATSVVETYTRPSGTSFSLSGRGFGHGRGISQHAAYCAAERLDPGRDPVLLLPEHHALHGGRQPHGADQATALGSSSTQLVADPGPCHYR